MGQRLELHTALKAVLGSSQVYFDGPSSNKMAYPAIVYKLDDIVTEHADNQPFRSQKRYQVILIASDPDTDLVDAIAGMPTAEFQRSYKVDNLHHFVFNLFF